MDFEEGDSGFSDLPQGRETLASLATVGINEGESQKDRRSDRSAAPTLLWRLPLGHNLGLLLVWGPNVGSCVY